jgi:type IV secretion system protein VirD4
LLAVPIHRPGEVMQLSPEDELVLVSGCHPIRAKKARYYEDGELATRILPPHVDDWACAVVAVPSTSATDYPANAGIRREPPVRDGDRVGGN